MRHVKIQSHVVHLWAIFSDSIHGTFENSMAQIMKYFSESSMSIVWLRNVCMGLSNRTNVCFLHVSEAHCVGLFTVHSLCSAVSVSGPILKGIICIYFVWINRKQPYQCRILASTWYHFNCLYIYIHPNTSTSNGRKGRSGQPNDYTGCGFIFHYLATESNDNILFGGDAWRANQQQSAV